MVNLRARDSIIIAQPKPKYGHLSALSPDFAPLKDAADQSFEELWQLPFDEFKAKWDSFPPALVDDSPKVGKDITVEHVKITTSDGSAIELRIYKPIDPVPNALLYLNAHGGGKYRSQVRWLSFTYGTVGWVVGKHDTEEGQNRLVAAVNKAVVVSVDYRMAPEFRFPYAIKDFFDALIWVCISAPRARSQLTR